MLNQVILVGRICNEPTLKENEKGTKNCYITVAVPRSYKNENGEYDTDFIGCQLWNVVAENTASFCKKGDLVGIKGSLQSYNYENENGEKVYKLNVVAEKVTFLSSKKETESEN